MKTVIGFVTLLLFAGSDALAVDKPRGTFASSGAAASGIYANPNLRGVLVRASWEEIEPTPGSFTFATIDAQVADIVSRGQSWSLAVVGGGTGSPAWLTAPVSSGGLGAPFITYSFRNVPGYKLPLFWDAIVQDRLAQLASALAARYTADNRLRLVYVTQMTANGIEGHLQGVAMSTLIAAGVDRDGDMDIDSADFAFSWIAAAKAAARSFALAFTNKPVAFEVHEVNGTHTIPETIIQDLWNDPSLDRRVGAAMWWISGKTDYQSQLIAALAAFPGDIYGQIIGKSGEGAWTPGTSYANGTFRMPVSPPITQRYRYEVTTSGVSGGSEPLWPTTLNAKVTDGTVVWTCRASRFLDGDFAAVFRQAKALGLRYIEPWEWEFNSTTNSAKGEWDSVLQDYNAWADATFADNGNTAPTISSIDPPTATMGTVIGPLAFTIGDTETPAASLTITGASSNATLLPQTGIVFGGDGSSRTVTLTPTAGQTGSSTINLTVSDGSLTAETSFLLVVVDGAAAVPSLVAQHRSGQTFLTWSEAADPTATYRLYRSSTPFLNAEQLSVANRIATVGSDSSFDARLSGLRSTDYHYRITAAGPDLGASQGLHVHTPMADGVSYYAVTTVIGGIEQLTLATGHNTTDAVHETAAMPEPVLQRTLTINNRNVEIYVHWVSATSTPFYPAMGNRDSVAHHFGLVRRGTASTHSLLIRPHARQGSFLSTVTGTNDADEWVLTLDDWMPNPIANTFWYGYHERFDIEAGGPAATTGLVHDYTLRRVKWEIEWALRTLPLDLNRIYMTGHSMGGIGSHFISLMLADKIAAIWTTSAKYDFGLLADPNPANIWNDGSGERAGSGDLMWGTVATNLTSSEGIPVYDRLNASYLLAAFRGIDQPVMIAYHGKNDTIVGWAEKIGFYTAMNAHRHGGHFFFDRGVHNRSGGEWQAAQSIHVLNRYRLDQSYPAFSNSSVNGNPGNGRATDGDSFGTLNGNLDWDTATIVDTTSRWQITLRTIALTPSTGTIAAPVSATVDITPRRLQAFPHAPGTLARYEVRDKDSQILRQSGLVTADIDGLFTVPAVTVTNAGTTLALAVVSTAAPALNVLSASFTLTWPTTSGVRYQIEWSPDLVQWLPASESKIADGTTMTWSDDGSQTGSAPSSQPSRFYRLRIGP